MVGSWSILYRPQLIFLIQVLVPLISAVREFLERAIACKIASGNHRVAMQLVLFTTATD